MTGTPWTGKADRDTVTLYAGNNPRQPDTALPDGQGFPAGQRYNCTVGGKHGADF